MEFPLFHLDFFGNRMLIAVIAVTHVIINHPMAVGAMPLVLFLEWMGRKQDSPEIDAFAYKALKICFIITTSLGAMTGVGIWLSASLVNPQAIGSLIRIFFWGWFTEWLIFIAEVVLIIIYTLKWKSWQGPLKTRHMWVGAGLSLMSWLTMAIIVAILGFMMHSGDWSQNPGLLVGVFNPLYLPQLAFRTPFAFFTAGLFFMFIMSWTVAEDNPKRPTMIKLLSVWTLTFLVLTLPGAYWYWSTVPEMLKASSSVALNTQAFENYGMQTFGAILATIAFTVGICCYGLTAPKKMPRVMLVIPFVFAVTWLGYFERVREFIRKPYVVQNYMYADGLRVKDYPLYKQEGVLKYATYAKVNTATSSNQLTAGHDVFLIACSRCHTSSGVNGIVQKFENLFGKEEWSNDKLSAYIKGMHNARPFMPPFPGNSDELEALCEWVKSQQKRRQRSAGAQKTGIGKPS